MTVVTLDNEAELLELAAKVRAADIGVALAAWSVRNEDDDVIEARQLRQRHLTTRTDPDGTICGSFRLPPLAGARLLTAISTTMMRSTAKRQTDDSGSSISAHLTAQGRSTRWGVRTGRPHAYSSGVAARHRRSLETSPRAPWSVGDDCFEHLASK